MLFVISKKRLEVKWMNTQCEEELLKPSAGWWLLNVSVGGWGGDAVISAAMPLQPSPVWHPALSHPSWPQCRVLTTELPASLHHRFLPSWAWRGLDPLPWSIWEELFNQVKEKKNIYTDICIIIQIYKKKRWIIEIEVEVLWWNAEIMHYDFSEVECTGNLLILYILN